MTETLQEYADSRGVSMRVDAEGGIIRGVKILGLRSRNGRIYLPQALSRAARLYEGAKVNVNHPKGDAAGPRDYQDRIGTIRNVAMRRGEGLFADLHFNPRHGLAEQLIWDAEHAPENVGFSHNVQAQTARRDRRLVVEKITKVQSVDLVADPATTRGLFESQAPVGGTQAAGPDAGAQPALAELTLNDLRRHRADLVDALLQPQAAELSRLREELEERSAREAAQQKQLTIRRLLREFHLPEPEADDPLTRSITSDRFLESLSAAPSEEAMRELIEERARLVRSLGGFDPSRRSADARPLSRDQYQAAAAGGLDTESFVRAITC